jgi:hypothetical protein
MMKLLLRGVLGRLLMLGEPWQKIECVAISVNDS